MRVEVRIKGERSPFEIDCVFYRVLRSKVEERVGRPVAAEAIEVLAIDGRQTKMSYHELVADNRT